MNNTNGQLVWSLVIVTYNRGEILPRTLRLAAEQTRPPAEIIVVEASPDWQRTRDRLMAELVPQYPAIDWQYVQAERAAVSAQRNQGIRLATADILFLIDDDSLMYSDCAEKVMAVYKNDCEEQVAGVSPIDVKQPPDELAPGAAAGHRGFAKGKRPVWWLRRWGRSLLRADDIFIPYDGAFPERPIPESVARLPVGRIRLMHGGE